MKDLCYNIINREIFFTKLVDSITEFYEKDYYGHSIGLRNLHIMIMTENYKPERFEKAANLSNERIQFLTEVQTIVNEESANHIYFF